MISRFESYLCIQLNSPVRGYLNAGKRSKHFSAVHRTANSIPEEVRIKNNSTMISWYPGHIAKAEKELSEYLKKVDVVIEVRDCRIPFATTHPLVPKWIGNKPLIVAIARLDQVSKVALKDWRTYYTMNPPHPETPQAKVFFVDGKLGSGISALKREALKAGVAINERRVRRGIQPRPVRAAVIGFPNVGKSAIINRLLGRKLAKSQNLPGVTRQLQWVRIGGITTKPENAIELLDSPGIIPARQFDQEAAVKLAICNDIGEASYDRVLVAAELCDRLNQLHRSHPSYVNMKAILERYKLPFDELRGDEIVFELGNTVYHGNQISAADRLLSDFRKDMLVYGSLEAPVLTKQEREIHLESTKEKKEVNHVSKAKKKKETIVKESETLPELLSPLDVGKGNYEGW